jgi:hypothetical protein
MTDNTEAWLKRAKEILAKGHTTAEAVPFVPSILAALYGPRSPQLDAFNSRMGNSKGLCVRLWHRIWMKLWISNAGTRNA